MPRFLTLLKGRTLGERYAVTSLVGAGGMGAVFAAQDTHLRRDVALKVIGLELADAQAEDRLRARFYREARAAARVQHPHIVTVFDLGRDEGTGVDFIVMELLRGEDLQARMNRQPPLTRREVLELLIQGADALGAAHVAGLVHRDIKPANLFLESAPGVRLRIMDFGIAGLHAEAENTATHLTVFGHGAPLSPAYAAPEQLRKETTISPACDVYSIAATAYELLTGTRIHSDEDRKRVIAGAAVTVPDMDVVGEGLAAVLRTALADAPQDRYHDGAALACALREVHAREFQELSHASAATPARVGRLATIISRFSDIGGYDHTCRLALELTGEHLDSWWAGLYQSHKGAPYEFSGIWAARGESIPPALPTGDVEASFPPDGSVMVPGRGAAIRDHLPGELGVGVCVRVGGWPTNALLLLGPRQSGDPYAEEDLAALRILGEVTALALSRTMMMFHYLKSHPPLLHAGARLVHPTSDELWGIVAETTPEHHFPNGDRGPAVRIVYGPGSDRRHVTSEWLPEQTLRGYRIESAPQGDSAHDG